MCTPSVPSVRPFACPTFFSNFGVCVVSGISSVDHVPRTAMHLIRINGDIVYFDYFKDNFASVVPVLVLDDVIIFSGNILVPKHNTETDGRSDRQT
jgi:hypothetical protein